MPMKMDQKEGKINNVGNIILGSISGAMSLDQYMGTKKINRK